MDSSDVSEISVKSEVIFLPESAGDAERRNTISHH